MKYGLHERNGRRLLFGEWAAFYPAFKILRPGRETVFVGNHRRETVAAANAYLDKGTMPDPLTNCVFDIPYQGQPS